jgi:hypothetical protein
MVVCKCGKSIEKVPDWLRAVDVEFVCNNCPERKVKNIASITLQLEPVALKVEEPEAAAEIAAVVPNDDLPV